MLLFAIGASIGLNASIASVVVVTKAGNCAQPATSNEVVVTNNAGKWQVVSQSGVEFTANYLICGAVTDVVEYIRNPSGKSMNCDVSLVSAVEEITSYGPFSGLRVANLDVADRLGPAEPTTAALVVVDDARTWASSAGQRNTALRSRDRINALFFPEATLRANMRVTAGRDGQHSGPHHSARAVWDDLLCRRVVRRLWRLR